jgi:hypothetical protein
LSLLAAFATEVQSKSEMKREYSPNYNASELPLDNLLDALWV